MQTIQFPLKLRELVLDVGASKHQHCVCVTHDLTFLKKINKPQEISNGKANTVKKSPMLTSEGFDLFCCSSSMKVTSASPDL